MKINQSNLCQLKLTDLMRVCEQMADFGATEVRFAVDWGYLANVMGSVNYTPVTRVADALEAFELTPMPCIGIHTPWKKSPSTFGTFTQNVVGIFGAVDYEVWNEPNLWAFGIGTPANYLKYLRAAAPHIRGAGGRVIHAGLAAYIDHRVAWFRNYSPATWLSQLYAAGESNDYDLLGYHPYALTTTEKFADPDTNPFGMSVMSDMAALRAAKGDTRPWSFTEVGYDHNKISLDLSAEYLWKQVPLLDAISADSIWYFCWRDTPGDGGRFGVVDKTGKPKQPYYDMVQELTI